MNNAAVWGGTTVSMARNTADCPIGQVAHGGFPLELDPGDEEEHREQPVGGPLAQAQVQMPGGWSDADLRKLAGENVLRAMEQAERVAARLQKERPASTLRYVAPDSAP